MRLSPLIHLGRTKSKLYESDNLNSNCISFSLWSRRSLTSVTFTHICIQWWFKLCRAINKYATKCQGKFSHILRLTQIGPCLDTCYTACRRRRHSIHCIYVFTLVLCHFLSTLFPVVVCTRFSSVHLRVRAVLVNYLPGADIERRVTTDYCFSMSSRSAPRDDVLLPLLFPNVTQSPSCSPL